MNLFTIEAEDARSGCRDWMVCIVAAEALGDALLLMPAGSRSVAATVRIGADAGPARLVDRLVGIARPRPPLPVLRH